MIYANHLFIFLFKLFVFELVINRRRKNLTSKTVIFYNRNAILIAILF